MRSRLSKSTFIRGLQCEKSLYLYKHHYKLKDPIPALVPELSYNDLDIKEGGTASNTFLSMVNGTFEGDIEETRRQLLEYCELDTFAMVKILEKLLQV